MILEVPVFFANEKKWMPVEVQFRTIAMDFWASIEHKVKYKKNIDDSTAEIVEKLKECAEGIHSLDMRMQEISEYIDSKDRTSEIQVRTGEIYDHRMSGRYKTSGVSSEK